MPRSERANITVRRTSESSNSTQAAGSPSSCVGAASDLAEAADLQRPIRHQQPGQLLSAEHNRALPGAGGSQNRITVGKAVSAWGAAAAAMTGTLLLHYPIATPHLRPSTPLTSFNTACIPPQNRRGRINRYSTRGPSQPADQKQTCRNQRVVVHTLLHGPTRASVQQL